MSAWRIFSQFSGHCVASAFTRCVVSVQPNSLLITLITLILHSHCKVVIVLVVICIVMIISTTWSSWLYFAPERCCKEKCVERTLGNVRLINFVAGGVCEQLYVCLQWRKALFECSSVFSETKLFVCTVFSETKGRLRRFNIHSCLSLSLPRPSESIVCGRSSDNISFKSQPWSNPRWQGWPKKRSSRSFWYSPLITRSW